MKLQGDSLYPLLEELVEKYEIPQFILHDPISIPHSYQSRPDIEISGLFAAMFSWGLRITIIQKSRELMSLMGSSPYDFIVHHKANHLKKILDFKHRTFQTTDLLYFIRFLKFHYTNHQSLESAFLENDKFISLEESLNSFRRYFFSMNDFPKRTQKHISHPLSGSTCKRLCMFLRWMVRHPDRGVDFGIWKSMKPADLKIPLDVHVHRVALRLGLLRSDKRNWKMVMSLTERLKEFNPEDPVRYDFALFNLGLRKSPL
ncbi:MAG: TIGR02757 family protein [Saprospiraceae bacterium]